MRARQGLRTSLTVGRTIIIKVLHMGLMGTSGLYEVTEWSRSSPFSLIYGRRRAGNIGYTGHGLNYP